MSAEAEAVEIAKAIIQHPTPIMKAKLSADCLVLGYMSNEMAHLSVAITRGDITVIGDLLRDWSVEWLLIGLTGETYTLQSWLIMFRESNPS